ncbi:MAG: Rpn family recombination-promoting nuclease/putative transposase, partial [Bacteroidales bacterium]|nr:Rpn family recombination-promoting nuclease/putative transposase [Bacteroidales bacterium]
GRSEADRKAVYDVYCQTESGGKFIVEMQNAFQQFFKDRSVFYASFPICDMAKKDTANERWNYELQPLYTVGILNFVFKDDVVLSDNGEIKKDVVVSEESEDEFRHDVMLVDTNNDNKIFYKKLAFIYLEMPKFKKTIEQCESFYDKWMFVLQNLSRLMERPKELQDRIFKKVFEQAEIAKYTPEEHFAYEESLKNMRDFNSIESSARNEGIRLGERQAKLEIAKNLKASGLDADFIAQNTGLTKEEISKL